MSFTTDRAGFDIRQHLNFDAVGRVACPACIQDGKTKQKNLSVDLNTGTYRCWRGCTSEQIREVIGIPKTKLEKGFGGTMALTHSTPIAKSNTITKSAIAQSQNRLQKSSEALQWLYSRGFTDEMIAHYQLGLDRWKDSHDAIAIPIPSGETFYRKLRIAPWLDDDDLPKWSQYGVPTTIFTTYLPENAIATWYCEGEWDAMRLGWLAKQQNVPIAVCCSTSGCGSIPSVEQLNQLPGNVLTWFDRNDTPTKNGIIPGDAGALKLAEAIGNRARIAEVPMPEGCPIPGWDVSNALDAGFTWADFEQAANQAMHIIPQIPTLKSHLTELLEQNPSNFQQMVELMNLSKQLGQPYRDLDQLSKALVAEQEQEQDQIESTDRLKTLLRTREPNLNLHDFLEPWFADILVKTAQAMPTAPEFLFTTLLSAAASQIGTSAQVIIKPSAKYKQPMVFWSAIVADSGSMKTPAQRVILDPLVELEKQAHDAYKAEMEAYECRKAAGENLPKPLRRRHLTKDATLETLQRIHADNPNGILYYRDEMAGAIKGRDQYRKGRGADEEAELDQWTGAAIIVDRADKSTCLPKSAISRTGSIQWEILADLMGDHRDTNGAWSRWLFCAADAPTRYLSLSQAEPDTGIAETLFSLYSELAQLPTQDYFLDDSAKRMFEYWQRQLVDEQQTQEALGLKLVYPKIEAYTARFALWLHIVNAVLRQETPTQMISGLTMGRAIQLAAYYLWQHRLIHTHNSPDAGLAGIALKIHKFVDRIGSASASKLKSGIRDLRKMAIEQIRQLMQTLAQSGYGQVEGEGKNMVYATAPPKIVTPIVEPTTPPEIDTIDNQIAPMSMLETQAAETTEPEIDTTDAMPTLAETFIEGQPIQVWRSTTSDRRSSGQWLLATYLQAIGRSVFSHRTQRLDDGHQVMFPNDDRPKPVAFADIRLLAAPS
jgi:regulator of replication initiation timing